MNIPIFRPTIRFVHNSTPHHKLEPFPDTIKGIQSMDYNSM